MPAPRVYTTYIEQPFADVLAAHLQQHYGDDPAALAKVLLLLPNRRSCIAMREAFLRMGDTACKLLPRMQPIGDIPEDEAFIGSLLANANIAVEPSRPTIAAAQRSIWLARYIMQHDAAMVQGWDQSVLLAEALGQLFDEFYRHEIGLTALHGLVPEAYAQHWSITLQFLQQISDAWQAYLETQQAVDEEAHHTAIRRKLAQTWGANPPDYPVIAAGSTGSLPSTAALLHVIARLPQGMVIVPGLDTHMRAKQWEALPATHPQATLKHALGMIDCPRDKVGYLEPLPAQPASHERIRRLLGSLQAEAAESGAGESDLIWHACRDQNEEALLLSMRIREALEEENKQVMVVTRDRVLARRLQQQLGRWDIVADDSAGAELSHTPSGVFFLLIAEMAASQAGALELMAMCKHPLCAAGRGAGQLRRLSRQLERKLLRGYRQQRGWQQLVSRAQQQGAMEAIECLEALEPCIIDFLKPFESGSASRRVSFDQLLQLHRACMEKLAATDKRTGAEILAESPEAEALTDMLDSLASMASLAGNIDPLEYPAVLRHFLAKTRFRKSYGFHPRVRILSPMEARMQHADLVLLAGMNEGIWPPAATGNPWLSIPMMQQLGLPGPEHAVAQAGHDMVSLLGAPQVVVSFSRRVGSKPSLPTRWLQRMLPAVMNNDEPHHPGEWQEWLYAMDKPDAQEKTVLNPPRPTPPIEAIKHQYSISQIEQLRRNPYAIYARSILGLKAIDEFNQDADAKLFGEIIHKAMEVYVRKRNAEPLPPDATLLEICGRQAFAPYKSIPQVGGFWWPRFEQMIPWIIEQEKALPIAQRMMAEQEVKAAIGDIELHGRIDRAELQENASALIIDYKTGGLPKAEEVALGFAPQLALCAVLLGTEHAEVREFQLNYWKLPGGEEKMDSWEMESKLKRQGVSTEECIRQAREGVAHMLAAYRNGQAFLVKPLEKYAPNYDDYAHLAREDEWRGWLNRAA